MSIIPNLLAIELDETKQAKKPMQGTHWYNILANPTYTFDFSYINTNVPKRSDLIVDDDSDEENDCE